MIIPLFAALFSAALAVPYEEYILAPGTRTLRPVSVYQVNGTVTDAEALTGDEPNGAVFDGPSGVTFDYGKNIAGLVYLTIGETDPDQYISITFSESSLWISGERSDGTADSGLDEALWIQPSGPGVYTVPRERERGGFRYLSLAHNGTGSVEVKDVYIHFTPMPHYAEDQLRNYTGFFHCEDELINRVWYAGAYTNQMCTIDPRYGNALPFLRIINSDDNITTPVPWYNNYTITNGTSALVDGAKRDRLVWAGDMAIAVPAIVVSYNDLISVQNSLDSLFALQNASTGQLPYAGRPFSELGIYSATYHLYTLIGVSDFYLYSGDYDYLTSLWSDWKRAMAFSLSFIDSSGLMNVTSPADWLRFGMGGHNIEANSILYYTLNAGLVLADALNDTTVVQNWTSAAAGIKAAANALLWDADAGMYRDNETTTLHPQDGNSWAVVSNITDEPAKNLAISQGLRERWTPYGAPAIEAADAVSPFISGFEIQAHVRAGNATRGLELVRLQWGFMLDDPRMTNSTFIEGYSTTGELHYAPYVNDPRISHAHGWATGPTGSLTFLVAGIQLVSAGGETWLIAPSLGDLQHVHAGFSTSVGTFEVEVRKEADGNGFSMSFETPEGTEGV
ncbi:hypothetical protein H2199_003645 [Coniosporium tulheliwenetii]|uniref:Uncharacterized protein n=1 Tax=Coniosporium tulheliwenetii TaxID=3383036 RepID=A0ACC2ZAA3_9PEZI|nr:hypothetical protein H2199_003645 [Cladosporium sp. JES 115]